MITTITINNNEKTPFKYASRIEAFKNGTEFVFKPGVNIIIGKNGSGKSTLLKMIAKYMLCENSMCSEVPDEALAFPDVFDDEDQILDGVSIKADYAGKVFNLVQQSEMNNYDALKNSHNFGLYMNSASSSSGEKNICAIGTLFNFIFSRQDYEFPIRGLAEYKKKSNRFWIARIDNLLRYYVNNHIKISEKDFEYTTLMDEPDRNLDIDNISNLYDVLSIHKPQTQIIAVIHNPALIYKLSELDCVNFIEMSKGYLKKIRVFMKGVKVKKNKERNA